MGPPTQITTSGEARKARRQKFSGDRAREEVCHVHPVQGNTQGTSKGEVSAAANVTPSTTTNEKGTGESLPQTAADPPISSKDAKNAIPKGKILRPIFRRQRKKPIRFG